MIRGNHWNMVRLGGLLLLAVVGVLCFWFFPAREWIRELLEQLQAMGAWGPVWLVVAYVVATVLFVPGSVLSLGAGFAFGVVRGTIAVSIGSTLGATAAWLIGRFVARRWIEQRMAHNPRFEAIDRALGEQGFRIVLLLRLSPVFPFNLLNYVLGLTRVSFRDYVLASWIGMLAPTVTIVYIGSTLRSVADALEGDMGMRPAQQVLFAVGLAATIAVTIVVTRAARRALRDLVPAELPRQDAPTEHRD